MAVPVVGISGRSDQSARSPSTPVVSIGESYVRAVELGGGAPVIVAPHPDKDRLQAIFDRLDGLVLSGGGDVLPKLYGEEDGGLLWSVDEGRDQAELMMARWALSKGLPVLAICRGIQVLNVAAGGTLIQDVGTQVPDALSHAIIAGRPMASVAHTVDVVERTRLAALFGRGELEVNSAHHQAAKSVGEGLLVTARAPDGVIEGLEKPDHPFCVGVQWHPEAMVDSRPVMRRLFEALAEAALHTSA